MNYTNFHVFTFQVALKRQQAAEDAIAIGIRAANVPSSTSSTTYLEPGPVFPSSESLSDNHEQSDNDLESDSVGLSQGGMSVLFVELLNVRQIKSVQTPTSCQRHDTACPH